jgi:subtilisin family serine protease
MDFPVFRKVVQKALDKGIVVIAAAGNYGSDDLFYPAAYEEVIAV